MTFSVVIPTFNRCRLLEATLDSLFRQDSTDFEIIVVDDGSTDRTMVMLRSLEESGRIRYLRQSNRGPAIARNAGIKAATGHYIAFTDDDCVVPPDWLSTLRRRLGATGAGVIGGSTITGNPENPFAVVNDLMVNYLKDAMNSRQGADIPFLTTNNAAYKRVILEKVGGFDSGFTIGAEERELNYRIGKSGEPVVYDASIVVRHFNDERWSTFLRHQFRQGEGSWLFYSRGKRLFGRRPPAIPPGVYAGLLVSPFRGMPIQRAILSAGLIILAQCAVAAGFFSIVLKSFMNSATGRTG